MGLDVDYIDDQTPLDEEDKEGLLILTIATRSELDEFEQQNIEEAMHWIAGRSFKVDAIFNEKFVKGLHKRMFGNVWRWAGVFRKTNKNIGVDKLQISVALRALLDDTLFWIEHSTFSPDEIAVRFKHRLVAIHCFPNGNGRHSRLFADLIIIKVFGNPVFSWGTKNLVYEGDARKQYIKAIIEADNGNYGPLLEFARS